MILVDVEVYNHIKKRYELLEAIIDTGATFCAVAKHIADETGLPLNACFTEVSLLTLY